MSTVVVNNEKRKSKVSKGTMTDISLLSRTLRPTQVWSGAPRRRRLSFADRDRLRQSDLTDQEVRLTRSIWAEYVEPNKEQCLTLVFNEFFTRHPEISDLFVRLDAAGLPRLDAPLPEFRSRHLSRIMARLRQMMDSLDRPTRLTKLMTKMGVVLAKVEVDSSYVDEFQEMIIATIRLAMDNQMHPSEEVALRKCFNLAFSIMEEASFTYYDLFVATNIKAGR